MTKKDEIILDLQTRLDAAEAEVQRQEELLKRNGRHIDRLERSIDGYITLVNAGDAAKAELEKRIQQLEATYQKQVNIRINL
jgi:chromosome segregation ATPase